MWTGRPFLCVALLSSILFACKGDPGVPGTPGSNGSSGDPGKPAPTTGTLEGMITDGVTSQVLMNVAVTAMDAGGGVLATTTTGVDGRFTFEVTAGPVDLSFDKALYTSPGVLHSGVGIGEHVQVSVTMSEAASGKPSVLLAVAGDDFGYGATVPVMAVASDPNDFDLAFAWKNATWPVLGSVTGTGANATVTFPTMDQAFAARPDTNNPGQFISGYALRDRFGIVPIMPDTRGQMTASVTVDDGHGQKTSASLTINAASVAADHKNLPLHQRVYVNSGHTGTSAWTITSAPAGSTAAFDDPTARTPSFVPDMIGPYTIAEGANTMTVYASTWFGAIGGGSGDDITVSGRCSVCHQNPTLQAQFDIPDVFTPWTQTAHATTLTRGMNGDLSDHFSGACVGCHTTGYDLGVANGGFDDVAKTTGWLMPALDAANWTNLVASDPQLAQVSNVQCESCHGPQGGLAGDPGGFTIAHTKTWDANQKSQPFQSPRISYASEVCGTCHAAGADHKYSEWATADPTGMSHSNRGGENGASASATGLNSSCGRCHSAQGYMMYAAALGSGAVALASSDPRLALVKPANNEPITCTACHDPHDATNPSQLRFFGNTPKLPGGFAAYGAGAGALCITCHNSRNGAQTGSLVATYLHEDGELYNSGNPTGYSAPHQAAQGDVFTGHNAYFMGTNMPMTSKHAAIKDTCVGCHMTLQPDTFMAFGFPAAQTHKFRITDANKSSLCTNCHGNGSVDGDGIQGQVEAQLTNLGSKLATAFVAKANAAQPTTLSHTIYVCAWDPTTDTYTAKSCGSATTANGLVAIDTSVNPLKSATIDEIHGQVGFIVTLTTPITLTFVNSAGAVVATGSYASFGLQMGSLLDSTGVTTSTPTGPAGALFKLNGNFVRAGWNYFLVEGDQSKGLHNPSFVNAVLNNSVAKDLSN